MKNMKKRYAFLIALCSLLLGFLLSNFYSAPAPMPSPTTLSFSPGNTTLRMIRGVKQANDNYYFNVLTYAADSINVTGLDSFNTKQGFNIAYNGSGNYLFTATHGTIDSIPRSVFSTVTYTLVDSTIYTRNGVMYGYDNTTTKWQTFSINDVINVTGGKGTVTFAVINVETYE
jgi:hypothetical protein